MEKSSRNDESVGENIANWAMKPQTLVRSHIFDAFYLISVICFLSAFKLGRDTNGTPESAAMWQFHFFMKGSFEAALNAH